MPKIGICSDCGLVKTILCKNLCENCYRRIKNNARYHKNHPLKPQTCSYCGSVFYTSDNRKIYCSETCKIRDVHIHSKLLGYVRKGKCPKCHGNYGQLYEVTVSTKRKNNPIKHRTYYVIRHFKVVYLGRKKNLKGKMEDLNKRKSLGSCWFGKSLPHIP